LTRDAPEKDSGTSHTRNIIIDRPLAIDVDKDIAQRRGCTNIFNRSGTRSTAVPEPFQYTGLASHVLLAACDAKEKALEEGGRGVFTVALLEVIKQIGFQNLTYAESIRRLPRLRKYIYFTILHLMH
jgi:hypothetical protein